MTTTSLDPRVQEYLDEIEKRKSMSSDPRYQASLGTSNLAAQKAMQDQQDLAGYSKAFSQMGQLKGRAADTSGIQDVATANAKRIAQNQQGIAEQELGREQARDKQSSNKMKIAEYLQSRTDKQTELADRKSERQEDRDWRVAQDERNFSQQKQLAGVAAGNARSLEELRSKNDMSLAELRGKQQPISGTSGSPLDKAQVRQNQEADYRYIALKNNAQKLKDLIKREGTSSFTGSAGVDMDSTIYQMAVDYAKLVDPDSVAREGEVAAAQKYMLPFRENMGLTTRNSTAQQQVDNYITSLDARLAARKASQSGDIGAQTYASKPERESGTAVAAPAQSGLEVGHEEDGYVYKGGDPKDPSSWEKR
jgi:hypothetical protein